MTLNLLTRREYYCDSNNKYYCRIQTFSPEAPYLVNWLVWSDKDNGYVSADSNQVSMLEQNYIERFVL